MAGAAHSLMCGPVRRMTDDGCTINDFFILHGSGKPSAEETLENGEKMK